MGSLMPRKAQKACTYILYRCMWVTRWICRLSISDAGGQVVVAVVVVEVVVVLLMVLVAAAVEEEIGRMLLVLGLRREELEVLEVLEVLLM